MTKVAVIALLAAVNAVADVTPNAPRLELTRGSAELQGGVYTFQLIHVRTDKEGTVRASFLLTKNDLDHGVLSTEQGLKVGESLGVTSRLSPNDLRRFSDKLRTLLADENPPAFDPQTKIVLMRQYPDWPIRRCHLEEFPGGNVCMGFSEWRSKVPVYEVILEEKSGRRIMLRAPGPHAKMPPDKHCSVHGGKIPARRATEAEKNIVNAGYYLSEADEYWKSRNPKVRKLAQEAYRRLLKEFPTEAVVMRNLERIKERAEAEIED